MSPIESKHFLKDWQRDSQFYGELKLLMTIKSFDLQAIRARYLASKKNASGKGGSVERRAVSLGGLAQVSLKAGALTEDWVKGDLKEPRGLTSFGKKWAYSVEDRVVVIEQEQEQEQELEREFNFSYPWFSYIHTVNFHPEKEDCILVTSSGFDSVFEFNYKTGSLIWEWFSWEHGLDLGHSKEGDSIRITRKGEIFEAYQNRGEAALLISDPTKDHLPTAQRAAFINTAVYDGSDTFLATLFHEGTVRSVDIKSGESEVLLSGMKSPHGAKRLADGSLLCTNTGGGEVWHLKDDHLQRYAFADLPGKAEAMQGVEWLQNTIALNDYFIAIDANRNALVVFNPEQKIYDMLSFSADWAVQDLAILPTR
tara:strand:- start:283 stop:1386 length:1104 start_codon:yes stop_codon:yes gene_type:complete